MNPTGPPNYGPQPARIGPRCDMCEFMTRDSLTCTKYAVLVKVYYRCDSWERDPNLPIKAV